MREINDMRTLCEVLREINDIATDDRIKEKLIEATIMAKKMDKKLRANKKDWDHKFWEKNPNAIKFSDKDIYKD